MKYDTSFNSDFQKIILDITGIAFEEVLDHFSCGLKPYIWKEICIQDNASLTEDMGDAERIEAAHLRIQGHMMIKM